MLVGVHVVYFTSNTRLVLYGYSFVSVNTAVCNIVNYVGYELVYLFIVIASHDVLLLYQACLYNF